MSLDFWADDNREPPLDDATLARCEQEFGVRFPAALVTLYQAHNGGPVRDADELCFNSLNGRRGFQCLAPLVDETGSAPNIDDVTLDWIKGEIGDPRLILALYGDGHVVHALDFNERGPRGEPSIVCIDTECMDWSRASHSFAAFIQKLSAADPQPAFDWSEHTSLPVVASQTLQIQYVVPAGATETIEQVLCDAGDSFAFYRRSAGVQGVRGEELERTLIAKPLGDLHIQPMRPAPTPTFMMTLAPRQQGRITATMCRRTSRGWKNETSDGVPIYAGYESADRGALQALREKLLGGQAPAEIVAQEKLQQRLAAMTEAEQQAAFPYMMLQGMQLMEQLTNELGQASVPEELADIHQHFEKLRAHMEQKLEERAASSTPPPAELQELIDQMFSVMKSPLEEEDEPDIDLETR